MTIALVTTDLASGRRVYAALRGPARQSSVLCFESSHPFADRVAAARPKAIVLDTRFPDEPLPTDAQDLRGRVPSATIVLLASRIDGGSLAAAAAKGVDIAVSRRIDSASLGALVREIAAGRVHAVAGPAAGGAPLDAVHDLSSRELQILRMVARGTSNAVIARGLWISECTVKYHLSNIFRKLGVANRTEASHYAYLHRLLVHGAPSAGLKEEAA
jgi:DNA-binding NarL/FixJ family response regulator